MTVLVRLQISLRLTCYVVAIYRQTSIERHFVELLR